jgi:hypothetical protein
MICFRRSLFLFVASLGVIVAGVVFAQLAPDSAGWEFTGPGGIARLPNHPFSAELTTQTTGKGRGTSRLYRLYRDSQGRTMSCPPFQSGGYSNNMTEIDDPAAGDWYILDARAQVAHKGAIPPRPPTPSLSPSTATAPNVLDMGMRIILGQQATGTITTTANGAQSVERWNCADLQLVLLMRAVNRSLTAVTEFTSLQLGDPPAAYFQVPSGYSVVNEPGPFTVLE